MDQPDRAAKLHFSQPIRQMLLMAMVLALTGLVLVLALPSILPVFAQSVYLNGFILFVFVLGVLACIWQVVTLAVAVRWIERFAQGETTATAPQMLAPLAALLGTRGARMQIATSSQRSILDSVAQRIDEAREITRYLASLLIFLGLLGTFYGLATTVPALVDTIRSLAPQEGEEGVAVFARLMSGLDQQLSGMGTAFGSSLLGLAGSLVIGLLELFAGHGQNRFYRELEEWLSSFTRVGYAGAEGESGLSAQVAEALGHQIEALQDTFARTESARAETDARLAALTDAVLRLTEGIAGQVQPAAALMRVAEGQDKLVTTLEAVERGEGLDAESRMRLRSIDVQLLRVLEEISAGRQESMTELRTDLAALTRVISMAGWAGGPAGRHRDAGS
jgi:hypothetical protein